jgi:N-acetylmuramoyl-L-alanine amidase
MRITYEGRTAYVAAAYVSETKPETSPETKTETGDVHLYDNDGILIAIDPGHQGKGNSDQEPIGPGASETKAKVSAGTTGVSTGIPENELTLAVSLYLRDELLARGYSVLMIRETAEVDISNAERAELANTYQAAAFVRVHANGASNQEVNGALTMCMTPSNPYNGSLYGDSRRLSDAVLSALCDATGALNKGVTETDTMSGINWCSVPVTIVEMGFMTNPAEDEAMATEAYRRALAKGIADGIDDYFGN